MFAIVQIHLNFQISVPVQCTVVRPLDALIQRSEWQIGISKLDMLARHVIDLCTSPGKRPFCSLPFLIRSDFEVMKYDQRENMLRVWGTVELSDLPCSIPKPEDNKSVASVVNSS